MSLIQYIKDTRGELRHVAWPTRLQTIVYTVLVILISIFVALYLGLFDLIFTGGVRTMLEVLPERSISAVFTPGDINVSTSSAAQSDAIF